MRVVFDASPKTSTGTSLNEQFMIGPTVHSPMVDVLLRFRQFKIALATDVSRMYRAVLLPESQRDLHRFVWRNDSTKKLEDYRMTRLTFWRLGLAVCREHGSKTKRLGIRAGVPTSFKSGCGIVLRG